jgi:hypothetical protein
VVDVDRQGTLLPAAEQRNALADTAESEGDGLGTDVDPDVRAAMLSGKALEEKLKDAQALYAVCPNVLD